MGWDNETGIYKYTSKVLRTIAENYESLYSDGLSFRESNPVTDPLSIAEYRIDFDAGLNGIGGGVWHGLNGTEFKDYRKYDRLQLVVIADIMDIEDKVLESLGLYEIHKLKGYAYREMCRVLNAET